MRVTLWMEDGEVEGEFVYVLIPIKILGSVYF